MFHNTLKVAQLVRAEQELEARSQARVSREARPNPSPVPGHWLPWLWSPTGETRGATPGAQAERAPRSPPRRDPCSSFAPRVRGTCRRLICEVLAYPLVDQAPSFAKTESVLDSSSRYTFSVLPAP